MGDPQIYVRGFPKYTTEQDLRAAFSAFGQIKEVRMIRDYAFIVFDSQDSVNKAVEEMNGKDLNDQRVKVEVAGQPKKPKGPQPNDQCRLCGKKGHWKNDCPELRRDRKRRRRSSSSSQSSSSSSSSSVKKKKKIKKHKGRSKRRRSSSSSSSSYSSSSSGSSPRKNQKKNQDRN